MMKKLAAFVAALAVLSTATAVGGTVADNRPAECRADPVHLTEAQLSGCGMHHEDNSHMVLNLVGTSYMEERMVPDIDGDGVDDPGMCFDMDLVNLATDKVVGTATDCLSAVNPSENGGVALVGTAYFRLPRGTIVTQGLTSVRPVLQPTTTPRGQLVTHITGASGEGNAVVSAGGHFDGMTGTARLSGMVDMSEFGGEEGDPISFDCIFVLDLV